MDILYFDLNLWLVAPTNAPNPHFHHFIRLNLNYLTVPYILQQFSNFDQNEIINL